MPISEPPGRRRLFAIGAGRPFADDLAAGLLSRSAGDALALARTVILLPNRRSAQALADAFVRQADGAALLLPRMVPVADLDGDDLPDAFMAGADAAPLPTLGLLARQVALARLLAGGGRGPAEAFALARHLGAALDLLTLEGRSAAELAAIDPGAELQIHWQKNRAILETVLRHWPGLLAARGAADPVARRVAQIDGLAARWRAAPPAFPVVAAGIVNAPPPVARLLGVVAGFGDGSVVLPGFDLRLGPADWEGIAGDSGGGVETHPQHAFARLLRGMGVAPAEVEPWPYAANAPAAPAARVHLVGRAMAPAAMAATLSATAQDADASATAGLRLLEAAGPVEEALLIALAMRQVVEVPGATAALVTPDRNLARRVQIQLQRFGIIVDDSAGQPLSAVPAGSLMLALADAVSEDFAPVPLLALLKHPLVRAGDGRLAWLERVRQLDRLALRGLRPAPGVSGVGRRVAARAGGEDGLRRWWEEEVSPLLRPLEAAGAADAAAFLGRCRTAAEALVGPALWDGDGGRALARLFEELEDAGDDLAAIALTAADAPTFLRALTDRVTVRPVWRRHPQLAIWGLLEARLQRADLMILGGLNEGTWPPAPAPDPFLAPAVRAALDLPGLSRTIGLMAHDFAVAAGAPTVLMTRAAREGGAPSVASRFWQRLAAVAGPLPDTATGLLPALPALIAAARALDRPERAIRIPPPAPAPPAHLRPRSLRLTEIATLKADPFSIYARRILRLEPLDPIDAEPTAADRGTIVHRILERCLKERESPAALIDAELARFSDRPELAALWRRRVERMVSFVLEQIDKDQIFVPFISEAAGEWLLDGIRLRGRADRVDRGPKGYRIIDYKTGAMPPVAKVHGHWDMQLPLLAAMLEAGALNDVAPGPVVALEYWKLSGGREPGETRPALGARNAPDLQAHVAAAVADLRALIGRYLLGDAPFTAKLHPVHSQAMRDYDRLARLAEWLGR